MSFVGYYVAFECSPLVADLVDSDAADYASHDSVSVRVTTALPCYSALMLVIQLWVGFWCGVEYLISDEHELGPYFSNSWRPFWYQSTWYQSSLTFATRMYCLGGSIFLIYMSITDVADVVFIEVQLEAGHELSKVYRSCSP
ncbi:hypothetical protein AAVH_18896 [Aphelenchoides avenae]|nr:hypothetical protein AAVH_18896 [Aphelenchus avenae]